MVCGRAVVVVEPATGRPSAHKEAGMKTILIVEDEAIAKDSLKAWLMESGYGVIVARVGYEALQIIEEKSFDVVLLDLRLPGKDGLQVLREAKLRKPNLRGIVITAYPTTESPVESPKMGAIGFLTKPLDLTRLEDLVKDTFKSTPAGNCPILVVDDEPGVREALVEWFIDAGYGAEAASDGEAALKLIGERDYSLLVLDLKLPGRDGIQVLREARRISPGIRGIIITAYPSIETAKEAMELGAAEYLVKPLVPSELENKVARSDGFDRTDIIPGPTTGDGLLAILRVVNEVADNPGLLNRLAEFPEETLSAHPGLSTEQKEALIGTDIRRVVGWISQFAGQKAPWFWCRLSQKNG